jgi:CHAD domain-containing protein
MMARTLAKHVRRTLAKHLLRFREDGGSALRSGSDEDLHALRVGLKQLRYNLEFFRSLLEGEAKDALDLLAVGQERLGTISDDDAFSRTYKALLEDLEQGDPRRRGLDARLQATKREREREVEALRALWDGGEKKPYPDRLAGCISEALGSLSNDDS